MASHSPCSGRRKALALSSATILATALTIVSRKVTLPHDGVYRFVLELMWSADPSGARVVGALILALILATAGVGMAGVAAAMGRRVAHRASWRLGGLGLAIWLLWVVGLGRAIANALYATGGAPSLELTAVIATTEGAALEALQASLRHLPIDSALSFVYSVLWVVMLLAAFPLLWWRGHSAAAMQLLVAVPLASLLALPAFIALPVVEPWAFHQLLPHSAPSIVYMHPAVGQAFLGTITSDAMWAVGACLPSMHVALPLVISVVAREAGARVTWAVYLALGMLTALTIALLGRHWLVDVGAAAALVLILRLGMRRSRLLQRCQRAIALLQA